MSQNKVHGVFPNHTVAEHAINGLNDAGFKPEAISIIGKDSDGFRQATATLQSTKCDRLVTWCGIVGSLIGAAAGLVGCPLIQMHGGTTLLMVPFWAVFCGTAMGLAFGINLGFLFRIDNIPDSEALVRLGEVSDGDIAVTVFSKNAGEQEQIQEIFAKNGAANISIDLVTVYGAEPRQELQLVEQPKPRLIKSA